MSESIVEVRGLEARYGRRPVLSGLDLAVPAGSVTAVLGPNGAGKSTLLRALTGELRARAGEVRVLGRDPARRTAKLRRELGYVPDRTELPRWMRVEDHLRLLEPFYPTWDRAEAARLVELFALDPRARYEDLSRGQRALENLVAALAHRPPLLLLDEPFSGLDPGARRRVFEGVLEHLREERRTVLLVSHSLVDVERCADRVAVLQGGRIVLEGDLEDVRRRAVRVVVTLAEGEEPWTPPGRPLVEQSGSETTLFYLDFDADLRRALESDPRVRGVELAARDLEDVVVAASKQEVAA